MLWHKDRDFVSPFLEEIDANFDSFAAESMVPMTNGNRVLLKPIKLTVITSQVIRSIFNGLPSLSFFFRFSLLMLCICWMVRDC